MVPNERAGVAGIGHERGGTKTGGRNSRSRSVDE